ncbi:RVP_2 domain-containing protein [Cephalotus follicularis]|uniref:RVP_2 domain-containing protein n=1 Tax=Cephalotus follicularis TaxID=3775 RepID=A0A1Q3CW31_CEPFO|nr:RVP_2 domain-containing protein [Cephalotus follicularis]
MEEEGKDRLASCENEDTNQQPKLSLHALTGAMGQQTMQVVGMIGRRPMQVLIDSGSTHNFLSVGLAHKLGLLVEDMPIVSVRVANGEQLPCSKVIKKFTLKMQGYVFGIDVFLIPLENYDLILGIQWLASLGDILWNFAELRMRFQYNNQACSLVGRDPSTLCCIKGHHLDKIISNFVGGSQLHLCSLIVEGMRSMVTCMVTKVQGMQPTESLEALLSEYKEIFAEPQGLPPLRNQDHRIPLKRGSFLPIGNPTCTQMCRKM